MSRWRVNTVSSGVLAAAVLLAPIASADGAPDETPAPDAANARREEARIRFNRGIELFDDKEYERALIEFERSYELSSQYQVLYNIGRVEMALHRYAKAVKAFERYLADGGDQIPQTRIEDVRRELKAARARTGQLLVRVKQEGAEILLDGAPLDTSPMASAALIDSGSRTLVVRKKGFQESSRVITLTSGDTSTIDFDLEPTARVERLVVEKNADGANRAPMVIAWGATGVLALGSGVAGLLALNAASDLDRAKSTAGSTNEQRADLADRASTFATVSTVLGIATVLAAGTAVFVTLRKPSNDKTTGSRSAVALSPVGLSGTF
jgi:tetratricopeptide (TPR) repeat protein